MATPKKKKLVFAADLSKTIGEVKKELPNVERLVRLSETIGLNIRVVRRKSSGQILPNCWLQAIEVDDKGNESARPLCFFPLVERKYAGIHGGDNRDWFMRNFKEVWEDAVKEYKELHGIKDEAPEKASADEESPF
jgi:hypothetical protein